ncbi:MAG TPA: hypothetical protein VM490_23385 [Armatimonadaceae bacterium]|nr:hypothetical protein [Armatimonadaceae bacterium]
MGSCWHCWCAPLRRAARWRSGIGMLRIAEVQKELKMTPEQVAKLDAKQDEVRQKMQTLFQGGGNPAEMTPAERQKRTEQMMEVQTKAVNEILDPTQQKRYRQLDLQQQGASALMRKDVADELKLTDEQKKALADAQVKADEDRRAAMQGVDFQGMSADDRAKLMTKMQDIQKASGDKMLAVLTDAQKTQWKEMQGTPFTFPAPTPGGPGGGRRPGGGGGGVGTR